MPDTLPVNLQRSVLGLLLFSEHAVSVRQSLDVKSWSGDAGVLSLVRRAYEYIDLYDRAPGVHTYELVESLSISDDAKNMLVNVVSNSDAGHLIVNRDYVNRCIEDFHRKSTLTATAEKLIENIQSNQLDKAEELIMSYSKRRLEVFNRGQRLSEIANEIILDRYVHNDNSYLQLGIGPLDSRHILPTRGELFVWVAASGAGKTWALVRCGAQGISRGFKVLHVSLEMGQKVVGPRYLMTLYGYSKYQMEKKFRVTLRDDDEFDVVGDRNYPVLDETGLHDAINLLDRDRYIDRSLIIKQFPTNTLTVKQLELFLDNLELYEKFIPDVVIVDYGDLMKLKSSDNPRHELSMIYKDLRGLAIQRNLMMISACQSNKEGAKATKIDKTHLAESWDKVAQADVISSYSATEAERTTGLARLYVAKARNSRDQWEMAITQNYEIGQFSGRAIELNLPRRDKMQEVIERVKQASGQVQPIITPNKPRRTK